MRERERERELPQIAAINIPSAKKSNFGALATAMMMSFVFIIVFLLVSHGNAFTTTTRKLSNKLPALAIGSPSRCSSGNIEANKKYNVHDSGGPHPQHCHRRFLSFLQLYVNPNDEGDESYFGGDNNYYDDFGDFGVIGGDSSSPSASSPIDSIGRILQERMNKLIQQEQRWQDQISQNWKLGQWSVRGCSLDPFSSDASAADTDTKIQISSLCALPNIDYDNDDTDVLLVGRTDGSLCWLQLGGSHDYLATFTQQLVAKDVETNDNKNKSSDETGFTVTQEMKRDGQAPLPGLSTTSSSGEITSEDDLASRYDDNSNNNSFELLAQLVVGQGPIRSMKVIDDLLFFVDDSRPSQIIQLSGKASSCSQTQQQTPSLPLEEVHTSAIVSLLTTDDGSMISTSDNGQVVFWKIQQHIMVPVHQFKVPIDNGVVLSCDLDSEYLYFGESNGMLYVYSNCAGTIEPLQTFKAFSNNGGGISAICAAGTGSMGTGGRTLQTKTIFAGSTRGEIRQWELIPRGNNQGAEFWPRLASQTIPGKAHRFDTVVSDQEDDSSSAILSLRVVEKDNVILAASSDRLDFWDPKSGKRHFDMQGLEFGNLPNFGIFGVACEIIKDASLMVTNGMGQYVCVHDFTIDPSSVEAFLEIDGSDEEDDNDDDWTM